MDGNGARVKSFEEREIVVSTARKPENCALIIFGATGDLSHRKLFPSLFHLHSDKRIPNSFAVVGLGRSRLSEDEFRNQMRESAKKAAGEDSFNNDEWDLWAPRIHYISGNLDDPTTFAALREKLTEIDNQFETNGNHLFFLAVPASVIELILEQLSKRNFLNPVDSPRPASWSRVIIEKPFGRDLKSAQKLNGIVSSLLKEEDIFRVDHYLGKETVQNITVFRFGNSIFEPVWNRKYVDHVQITVAEEIGIEGRGPFYDDTGVVRDIVQNHLLQVLALCAMEPPVSLRAEDIHKEKTKVFKALRPIVGEAAVKENVVLGQYKGYRNEPKVRPDSRIPTYAAMKAMIDNWRWQGVPFYFRTGKRLPKRLTEISVFFQGVPFCLFGGEDVGSTLENNVLTIRIQPNEGITLSFLCKVPGDDLVVNSVLMDFNYAEIFRKELGHEAYERLFLDAMRGDQTLFSCASGVELEWAFVTPILEAWESSTIEPSFYEPGSEGPKEAADLLARFGHSWKRLE